MRVIGTDFEGLGIALARHWGFPELIQQSMRRLPEGPVRRPQTPDERRRFAEAELRRAMRREMERKFAEVGGGE